jgi:hypothetical protein
MGNQADYFNEKGYRGEYDIGDRVFGRWNKIPFIGGVGNDRLISEVTGPEVTVHLDLPIRIGETTHRVIIVKHKDIKRLKSYD